MNRQLFVDRILEIENLTNNLGDDDADRLLNWGLSQVDGLIKHIASNEEADNKINQLIGVMRDINSLAGDLVSVKPDAMVDLKRKYHRFLDSSEFVDQDECNSITLRISKMTQHDFLEYIINWLNGKSE